MDYTQILSDYGEWLGFTQNGQCIISSHFISGVYGLPDYMHHTELTARSLLGSLPGNICLHGYYLPTDIAVPAALLKIENLHTMSGTDMDIAKIIPGLRHHAFLLFTVQPGLTDTQMTIDTYVDGKKMPEKKGQHFSEQHDFIHSIDYYFSLMHLPTSA